MANPSDQLGKNSPEPKPRGRVVSRAVLALVAIAALGVLADQANEDTPKKPAAAAPATTLPGAERAGTTETSLSKYEENRARLTKAFEVATAEDVNFCTVTDVRVGEPIEAPPEFPESGKLVPTLRFRFTQLPGRNHDLFCQKLPVDNAGHNLGVDYESSVTIRNTMEKDGHTQTWYTRPVPEEPDKTRAGKRGDEQYPTVEGQREYELIVPISPTRPGERLIEFIYGAHLTLNDSMVPDSSNFRQRENGDLNKVCGSATVNVFPDGSIELASKKRQAIEDE